MTREEVRRRAKRKTESSGSTMRGMTSSLHHCAVLERMRRIVDERTKNVKNCAIQKTRFRWACFTCQGLSIAL